MKTYQYQNHLAEFRNSLSKSRNVNLSRLSYNYYSRGLCHSGFSFTVTVIRRFIICFCKNVELFRTFSLNHVQIIGGWLKLDASVGTGNDWAVGLRPGSVIVSLLYPTTWVWSRRTFCRDRKGWRGEKRSTCNSEITSVPGRRFCGGRTPPPMSIFYPSLGNRPNVD